MASENKQPEQKPVAVSDPDQYAPSEGWPAGMFPSPIVDEHFNPYEDPQDKLDYYRMAGSQDFILQKTTLDAVRRHSGEPSGYCTMADAAREAAMMIEGSEKRHRVRQAFSRREKREQP